MSKHYIALIHKEPDSGYGVSFPDVPGVTAVADTLDDALREASVALGFAFEDWEGALRPLARRTAAEPRVSRLVGRRLIAAVAPAEEWRTPLEASPHPTAIISISMSNSIGQPDTGTKLRDGKFSGKCLA